MKDQTGSKASPSHENCRWASVFYESREREGKPTFDVVHFPLVDSQVGCESRLVVGSSPASVQIKQSFLLAVTIMRKKEAPK